MNFQPILRKAKKALPIILPIISVAGVFATGILSAKATIKALEQAEERDDAWKCYIPAALTAIATASCIIGCGVLNYKRQASLLSAYALLANSYKQYREKTRELYGEEADKKIISTIAIAKAHPKLQRVTPGELSLSTLDWGTDDEEVKHTFFESRSGTPFVSTINRVLQAELSVLADMNDGKFVSMNDFYRYLGLPERIGEDLYGWCTCDGLSVVEFNHYKAVVDDPIDGHEPMEVLVIDYTNLPETEDVLLGLEEVTQN